MCIAVHPNLKYPVFTHVPIFFIPTRQSWAFGIVIASDVRPSVWPIVRLLAFRF